MWGEENQSEKPFACYLGKIGPLIGVQRCPVILPRIKWHVLMIWEDHSSRGFVPSQPWFFFPGDSSLFPDLYWTVIRDWGLLAQPLCSTGAMVHLALMPYRCNTCVSFAMGTCGFLRVSLEVVFWGLGFVCVFASYERQCICSLFWDRSCWLGQEANKCRPVKDHF